MDERKTQFLAELQSIEKQGTALWLEGKPSSSLGVTNAIFVNEGNAYMRDYVYDKGVLKELRFDKINYMK